VVSRRGAHVKKKKGADISHDEAVAWMRARIAERRKVTNDR
jgi:hypothetical protein